MEKEIITFESAKVRRTEHNGEWFFAIEDIVFILTKSVNPKDYIKKMKNRDKKLQEGWGQIVTPLSMQTSGGKQKINCANLEGCFRIIQSIPSPEAEPIKLWLAKVAYERIKEIENPELSQERMMEVYKQKGYSENWIKQRVQSIITRKELTDEWKMRGAVEQDYSVFTAIMSQATFGIKPSEHKKIKGLKKENLRDHMTNIEVALVNLGEATATELHKNNDTQGVKNLKQDVQIAGQIAGTARKNIENKIGTSVISKNNFLDLNKKEIKKIEE